MAFFDVEAQNYTFKPITWKRDDVFKVWKHGIDTLPSYQHYLNNVDESGKIKYLNSLNFRAHLIFAQSRCANKWLREITNFSRILLREN